MTYVFEFHDNPDAFLAAVDGLVAANPLESTVVATVTARLARATDGTRPAAAPPPWWVVIRSRDTVVGAAMRTAPFLPFPLYLLAMPSAAAVGLARALHGRGEEIHAVDGDAAAAGACAGELARLTDRRVLVAERMVLQEVTEIVEPGLLPGALREARSGDVDQVHAWFDAFSADAAEQAGSAHPHPSPIETRESTLARIENGEVWLWEVDGVAVHATAYNPPSHGVARIGPVYTPKDRRGHGYAAAAVAQVSQMLLATGARVCLFADQANPASLGLYQRLGYRPVVEMTNLLLVSG